MTGDQRLILKIEHAVKQLEADQLRAAYHVLDEILRELVPQSNTLHPSMMDLGHPAARPPIAAAG